jgi:hypothetical protein
MMNTFVSDVGRDQLEDLARDHIPLSVHFLALRVRVNLDILQAVHEKRL